MRLPLTLRLMFHGLRSVAQAIVITLVGWIVFVPATAAERTALGATPDATRPAGLMEMRIAQVMVDFAPERFARLLSMASNGELSPDFAGMILRQIASGQMARSGGQGQPPGRSTGGAKFVTVESP